MRIDIITKDAKSLETKIFKAVGKTLLTWEERKESGTTRHFLTPVANQYKNVVLLVLIPNAKNDILAVYPVRYNNADEPTEAVKAIVLGNFTAALLTHFTADFSKLETFA